jgi:hypothetical protein
VDSRIKFEWRWSAPVRGMSAKDLAVTWDGFIRTPRKDKYGFFLVFERGARWTIDGVEVSDFPKGNSDKFAQVILDLEAGVHAIKVEY